MIIRFSPDVALRLETIMVQARGRSVSGVGFVTWNSATKEFEVYKVVLLGVGEREVTDVSCARLDDIFLRSKDANYLRLWWHSHDFGDGYPDSDNWSASDERICRERPLGLHPVDLAWSISAVRTPAGWIGRYDRYDNQPGTYHIQVLPNYAPQIDEQVQNILQSPMMSGVSSPIAEYYNSGAYFDYEAFSDEYEDVRSAELRSMTSYADYYEEYEEPSDNHDIGDEDDEDDSFEQFVFMGGLDPSNW